MAVDRDLQLLINPTYREEFSVYEVSGHPTIDLLLRYSLRKKFRTIPRPRRRVSIQSQAGSGSFERMLANHFQLLFSFCRNNFTYARYWDLFRSSNQLNKNWNRQYLIGPRRSLIAEILLTETMRNISRKCIFGVHTVISPFYLLLINLFSSWKSI